jgi:hypothetical protein
MFDYNDCASSVTSKGTYACAVNCASDKINNTVCNPECLSSICNYDGKEL